MCQNMARFAWEKPGERAHSFGNAKIQTIKNYMQLFQQKFLQKISFWKTFPPNKNHNQLQIIKLKIFSENFPTKPPSTKYIFYPPIHITFSNGIHQLLTTVTTIAHLLLSWFKPFTLQINIQDLCNFSKQWMKANCCFQNSQGMP